MTPAWQWHVQVRWWHVAYLIIPASNADSRVAELDNVETWSRLNNLRLNRSKSVEIVFINSKRKCKSKFQSPPPIDGISRVTSLKILGVTITSNLSATEHVRQVLQSSAETLYALRILRSQGMNNTDLQTVYTEQLLSRSCFMLPVCGSVSQRLLTGSE